MTGDISIREVRYPEDFAAMAAMIRYKKVLARPDIERRLARFRPAASLPPHAMYAD